MSATHEEVLTLSNGLVQQHGTEMLALVTMADFLVTMAGPASEAKRLDVVDTARRCIGAKLEAMGKTWDDYKAACHAFYTAQHTILELNALPD